MAEVVAKQDLKSESDQRIISTELNLLRFPLFSFADKKALDKETHRFPIEFEHQVNQGGKTVTKTFKGTGEISFNNKHGKPLRRHKKFLRAIEILMMKSGFPTPRYFVFDPKDVLRELGTWPLLRVVMVSERLWDQQHDVIALQRLPEDPGMQQRERWAEPWS